uniref:Uncharacterized protein n=1 Tax=viral metagenome TaxID=1070528 RepID=A0A6M3M146_9ZZZZ
MPPKGFKQITVSNELYSRIQGIAKNESQSMPDLIRKMLGVQYNVDKLLEIIDHQLAHQSKQKQIDYSRGFVRGIKWVQSEIRKVFER